MPDRRRNPASAPANRRRFCRTSMERNRAGDQPLPEPPLVTCHNGAEYGRQLSCRSALARRWGHSIAGSRFEPRRGELSLVSPRAAVGRRWAADWSVVRSPDRNSRGSCTKIAAPATRSAATGGSAELSRNGQPVGDPPTQACCAPCLYATKLATAAGFTRDPAQATELNSRSAGFETGHRRHHRNPHMQAPTSPQGIEGGALVGPGNKRRSCQIMITAALSMRPRPPRR